MKKFLTIIVLLVLAVGLGGSLIQAEEEISGDLVVLHAGSLSIPFSDMEETFEQMYPNVDVKREAAGSRTTVRKVTDLNRKADVIGSADYTVIEQLMVPGYTDWFINFATNEMVIMYTPHSTYAEEINSVNWYNILLRENVEFGHSEPNADPCGYRSQLVWKLAEKYYRENNLYQRLSDDCPDNNVRPKETDLIALLEAGSLDYIFIYRSVAEQHNMPYVKLPDKINLKTQKHSDFYKQAKYDVSGSKPGEKITKVGQPMVYGITIPDNAPNRKAAELFVGFVIDKNGQEILEKNGQPPIIPAVADGINNLPNNLKPLVKGE